MKKIEDNNTLVRERRERRGVGTRGCVFFFVGPTPHPPLPLSPFLVGLCRRRPRRQARRQGRRPLPVRRAGGQGQHPGAPRRQEEGVRAADGRLRRARRGQQDWHHLKRDLSPRRVPSSVFPIRFLFPSLLCNKTTNLFVLGGGAGDVLSLSSPSLASFGPTAPQPRRKKRGAHGSMRRGETQEGKRRPPHSLLGFRPPRSLSARPACPAHTERTKGTSRGRGERDAPPVNRSRWAVRAPTLGLLSPRLPTCPSAAQPRRENRDAPGFER